MNISLAFIWISAFGFAFFFSLLWEGVACLVTLGGIRRTTHFEKIGAVIGWEHVHNVQRVDTPVLS